MTISAAHIRMIVAKAINTQIGDLNSTVTYVAVTTTAAYDVATDVQSKTETTHTNVKCALVKLTEEDLGWFPANSKGQRALIPYNNLPITPAEDDYLIIDGKTWEVFKIKLLPGRPLHILYIRET